jgi:hypothetical protein
MVLGKLDIHVDKNETNPYLSPIPNQLKMVKNLRFDIFKLLQGKHFKN